MSRHEANGVMCPAAFEISSYYSSLKLQLSENPLQILILCSCKQLVCNNATLNYTTTPMCNAHLQSYQTLCYLTTVEHKKWSRYGGWDAPIQGVNMLTCSVSGEVMHINAVKCDCGISWHACVCCH